MNFLDRGWDWLLKWMLNRHLPVVREQSNHLSPA